MQKSRNYEHHTHHCPPASRDRPSGYVAASRNVGRVNFGPSLGPVLAGPRLGGLVSHSRRQRPRPRGQFRRPCISRVSLAFEDGSASGAVSPEGPREHAREASASTPSGPGAPVAQHAGRACTPVPIDRRGEVGSQPGRSVGQGGRQPRHAPVPCRSPSPLGYSTALEREAVRLQGPAAGKDPPITSFLSLPSFAPSWGRTAIAGRPKPRNGPVYRSSRVWRHRFSSRQHSVQATGRAAAVGIQARSARLAGRAPLTGRGIRGRGASIRQVVPPQSQADSGEHSGISAAFTFAGPVGKGGLSPWWTQGQAGDEVLLPGKHPTGGRAGPDRAAEIRCPAIMAVQRFQPRRHRHSMVALDQTTVAQK